MSQKKHPYFNEHRFDKSYRSVTRSFKLEPNEKALISHIISWQETTDEKSGELLGLVCFESNKTISDELGIPFKTLEELIREMNKKYDFFTSTGVPGKGASKNGGNLNRTYKIVDMPKLVAFLEAEQKETEENGGVPVPKRKRPTRKAKPKPTAEPIRTAQETFQKVSEPISNIDKNVAMMFLGEQFQSAVDRGDIDLGEDVEDIALKLRVYVMNLEGISLSDKVQFTEWLTIFKNEDIIPILEQYNSNKAA